MQELWKDIKGYEGLYQISNLGRVKRLQRIMDLGKSKFAKTNRFTIIPEMIMRVHKSKKICHFDNYNISYLRNSICLTKNGKSKHFYIWNLVANAFLPNPNNYKYAVHIGDTLDDSVSNLMWTNNRTKKGRINKKYHIPKPPKPFDYYSYRGKYKRFYNVEIPFGFDVHHIDKNRQNNNMKNLVLLPRQLHLRYHYLSRKWNDFQDSQELNYIKSLIAIYIEKRDNLYKGCFNLFS